MALKHLTAKYISENLNQECLDLFPCKKTHFIVISNKLHDTSVFGNREDAQKYEKLLNIFYNCDDHNIKEKKNFIVTDEDIKLTEYLRTELDHPCEAWMIR